MTYTDYKIVTRTIRGQEVLKLIDTPDFIEQWNHLHRQTGGFSVLQSKEFLATWYKLYHETLEPVLCLAYRGQRAVGLMGLAWHKTENYLTHAGEFEAEYHGWLVIPGFEEVFLNQCLQILKKQFPISKWEWLWMPPNTSIDLLEAALPDDMKMTLNIQEAPNWDLRNPEKLKKLRKSKSLKSKMKRFQRRGAVVFEVIEEVDRLAEVLKQAKGQYDFRQEGAYGISPFADDPRKEALTLKLFEAGIAHASVLWLDDKVLAFHFGCKDDKRVCLGIISYDPSESRLSPGTLIIIELADRLTQDGYHYFDLTPGTDSYKDRFANEYQTLYQPTISFVKKRDIIEKIKRRGINTFKKFMKQIGLRIGTLRNIKNSLEELPENISILRRHHSWLYLIKNALFNKQQINIYSVNRFNENVLASDKIQTQHFEHLMQYDDYVPFLQNRKLYQHSLAKFSDGATLFSIANQENLHWFAWKLGTKKPIQLSTIQKPITLETGQVICDIYQNSTAIDTQVFSDNIEQVLSTCTISEDNPTFLILTGNQQLNSKLIEDWDIELKEKRTWIRIFYLFNWEV